MLGLLDYSDALLELNVDTRLQAIYWRNQEALRAMDIDVSSIEYEILKDCLSWWGSSIIPSKNNRKECYRELCLILDNTDTLDYRNYDLWESVSYWFTVGKKLDLEERYHKFEYSLCAATMVIIGYAETLKAGFIGLDNQEIKSNILFNIAFLLAESGFFASSVLFNKKLRNSKQNREAREAGIRGAFKTKFKENVVYPKWQARMDMGIKRGDKADLINTVLELYYIAVEEAKKNGQKVTDSDRSLTRDTVTSWIKEFEGKGRSKMGKK